MSGINKSNKSNLIILFPQNIQYNYSYHYVGNYLKYTKVKKIKDMQSDFLDIINSNLISMNLVGINFGKSYTKVNKSKLVADFSFINVDKKNILLKADNNNDIVAIQNNKAVITTLKASTENEIKDLLEIFFRDSFNKRTLAPDWIKDIDFYTDKKCKDEIKKIDKEVENLNIQKDEFKNIIDENLKYKSILYETGEVLSKQINSMLSKIFEYDMSQFKDKYEEDGLIKLEDVTFIIETKGLNNEISGNNVSDACNHLIIYEDKLEAENIKENAKCLFIVAYERNKNIIDRVEIKERLEKIAKANNTLIIDTRVFLKIFEDFLNKKINKEQIKELFKENIGKLFYESK